MRVLNLTNNEPSYNSTKVVDHSSLSNIKNTLTDDESEEEKIMEVVLSYKPKKLVSNDASDCTVEMFKNASKALSLAFKTVR